MDEEMKEVFIKWYSVIKTKELKSPERKAAEEISFLDKEGYVVVKKEKVELTDRIARCIQLGIEYGDIEAGSPIAVAYCNLMKEGRDGS